MNEPKKSLSELEQIIRPYKKYQMCRMVHNRSQDMYVITDVHFKESDMTIWFTYHPYGNGFVRFSRPIEELFDGRFTISKSDIEEQ